MAASSVVFRFIVRLGSRGVLRDRGERRSRHAGCLHKINILTRQTRHQFLTRCTFSKEKLVRHSGQHGANHWPDPINLQEDTGRPNIAVELCVLQLEHTICGSNDHLRKVNLLYNIELGCYLTEWSPSWTSVSQSIVWAARKLQFTLHLSC